MMTLSEYLAAEGIPQEKFAERIRVRQATVSRLASNAMRPSLELAAAIERETGGAVPATSWVASRKGAA
ncbi:MAG: helix-turn-helix transcriptional regulator [Novosphingobium sp.]|nr:helix-turn-helix transcriptional regulator [Novosphingobium sp.]